MLVEKFYQYLGIDRCDITKEEVFDLLKLASKYILVTELPRYWIEKELEEAVLIWYIDKMEDGTLPFKEEKIYKVIKSLN